MSFFLLDTNILSELMRSEPNRNVLQWVDNQPIEALYISSITVAEIKLGIALLPDGKRKQLLLKLGDETLDEFSERRLPFDHHSASMYAEIVAKASQKGRTMSTEDAQIASIALQNHTTLVTRNTKNFDFIKSLRVYNPFSD